MLPLNRAGHTHISLSYRVLVCCCRLLPVGRGAKGGSGKAGSGAAGRTGQAEQGAAALYESYAAAAVPGGRRVHARHDSASCPGG